MLRLRTCSILLVLSCAVVSGCAQTAVVQCWKPAEIEVTGMKRIAVLDFSGENGKAVATALSAQLWKNEFYTVVDRSELNPEILPAGFHSQGSVASVLGPAKAAGIDGVILGEIVEYRCEDERFSSTEVNLYNGDGQHGDDHHHESGFGFSQNETLVREGTVTIAFRLVDVNTGEIRASKQVSHHFEGQVVNGQGSIPNKGEVLDLLTDDCLSEILTMLAPHQVDCQIELATNDLWTKGRTTVKQGVTLAKRGDWPGAAEKWEQALEQNPENHAALFNLAIAHAHSQNYCEAEDYGMRAVRIEHCDCYAKGLEKIRELRASYERVETQRVASAHDETETTWR